VLVLVFLAFGNIPLLRRAKGVRRGAAIMVCVYGLVNVWLTLGTLFWMRRLVDTNMILLSDKRTWGFGQVVALSSWLPM